MNDKKFDEAACVLPERIYGILKYIPRSVKDGTYEIRLRRKRPLTLFGREGCVFVYENSSVSHLSGENGVCLTDSEIDTAVERICSYSVYAHQSEMAEGFVTFGAGFRAGFCGRAVISGGSIQSVRDITSVNIRIARDLPDAANGLIENIYSCGGFRGILIAGPPCSGKTTMLKSLAYRLSSDLRSGFLKTVIIDERSELGTLCGLNCDILAGYPKNEGIIHALRTLSPQLIVCDELSDTAEAESVIRGMNTGVKFAVSVHCGDKKELMRRKVSRLLISSRCFDYIALLRGGESVGTVGGIYTPEELLYENDGNGADSYKLIFDGVYDNQTRERAL